MASRNTRSAITGDVVKQDRRKFYSGLIWLVLLLLLLAAGVIALFWCRAALSSRNPRFTLQQITIQSDGYWGKTPFSRKALAEHLHLEPGSSNLFQLDPGKIRETLLQVPNIGSATVRRELPDTVTITLEERTPRAFLAHSRSNYVIDETLHVMDARQCFGVYDTLPFIVGCKDTVRPGMPPLLSVKDAMELIMTVNRSFPDFRIEYVIVSHPDLLRCKMYARVNGRWFKDPFSVTMRRGESRRQLDILRETMLQIVRTENPGRSIDLSFDSGVVVR